LIARFGSKNLIVAGLWALAAGLVWLSFARPTGTFAIDVLPASLVAALGQALAFIPSLGMALSSAKPEEGGLASGIVNTAYQIGSALGLAAMTALALSSGAGELGNTIALTNGFSAAFLGAAALAVLGSFLALATIRTEAPKQEVSSL
ncbi:MFS transporter, partial [Amycolatopsis deserti]|uniref:MFS transporter n=1 Tax=Amycolatopsis deserti TaxID=185696 RepID=UPI00174BC6A5